MNFDASKTNCEFVQCAVCEQEIRGNRWFSRINHGGWLVALCSPECTNSFVADPDHYIRRIEKLELHPV